MKTALSQKLKTGIFVTAGAGVLLVVIFLIGTQKNLFSRTFSVQANFKNVSGLQVGNIVRFAGINVGTVADISILNDTIVQVSLQLQLPIKKFIKQDAIANIGSDGLMGDKIIEISSGSMERGIVKNNSLIMGKDPLNMDKLMNKFNAIATNAESFTNSLADIVQKVNHGQGSLGRLLNNDQLARNLEGTVSSAESTVKSIKKSSEGFNDNMQAVKSNFLLRGYFKKKERKRIADSTKNAQLKLKDTLQKKN